MDDDAVARAAAAIAGAGALLVGAGAGMGVDSGLPDFRGDQGFWKAYPPYAALGLSFVDLANPRWFETDPALAWGFYGHRLNLYRATRPHAGFTTLARWVARLPQGGFVYTSNVDGQFQRAGFDAGRVHEVHGSIHHLQCSQPCSGAIWPADAIQPVIDPASCLMRPPLPACPRCGALARPNVLMFGDDAWLGARTEAQYSRLEAWLAQVRRLLVIEIGAGLDVPSVRRMCEAQAAPLIRINPRAPEVPRMRDVGIAAGALDSLRRFREVLHR